MLEAGGHSRRAPKALKEGINTVASFLRFLVTDTIHPYSFCRRREWWFSMLSSKRLLEVWNVATFDVSSPKGLQLDTFMAALGISQVIVPRFVNYVYLTIVTVFLVNLKGSVHTVAQIFVRLVIRISRAHHILRGQGHLQTSLDCLRHHRPARSDKSIPRPKNERRGTLFKFLDWTRLNNNAIIGSFDWVTVPARLNGNVQNHLSVDTECMCRGDTFIHHALTFKLTSACNGTYPSPRGDQYVDEGRTSLLGSARKPYGLQI